MTAETNTDIPSLGAAKGDRLPNTVEQQYNIGLTYEYSSPLMGLSSFIRADYLYYGDSFATFGQSEDMFSPDYSKLNINWGMEIDENNSIENMVVMTLIKPVLMVFLVLKSLALNLILGLSLLPPIHLMRILHFLQ